MELLDYKKRVTDVMFLEEPLRKTDSIVLKSSNILRGSTQNTP